MLLVAGTLAGQSFDALQTTDDGSRLFFVSTNRQPGTSQSHRSKLFSWDAESGLRLVYEAPGEHVVTGLSISGDGQLAAFSNGAGGVLLDIATGRATAVGQFPHLSRNGRYLAGEKGILDRQTGMLRAVPPGADGAYGAYAGNDGSAVYRDLRTLHRIAPDGTDRIVFEQMRNARIFGVDENADRVLICDGGCFFLSTVTGNRVDVRQGSGVPLMSPDGGWFAARVLNVVNLCRVSVAECRPIPGVSGDPSSIGLSRDGEFMWSSHERTQTSTGARLATGFTYCAVTPAYDNVLTPGSRVRLRVSGPGERLLVNGREIPWVSPPRDGFADAQLPWDFAAPTALFSMPEGDCTLVVEGYPARVAEFAPSGFAGPFPQEGVYGYNAEWKPVTSASPVRPGELVHFYLVGLGPTDCALETGQPAPLDRLCRLTPSAEFRWIVEAGVTIPADVLFAGLAPGLVGIYQMDVRTPATRNSSGWVELTVGRASRAFAYVPLQ